MKERTNEDRLLDVTIISFFSDLLGARRRGGAARAGPQLPAGGGRPPHRRADAGEGPRQLHLRRRERGQHQDVARRQAASRR